MSQATSAPVNPREVARILLAYPLRWLVPTAALTAVALGYALFSTPKWEASQALLIRDEASSGQTRPGRFADVDSRKTAQETVLELAKSRPVVAAALADVEPPSAHTADQGPSAEAVEKLQGALQVRAPNGTEFGHTELFYLNVKDQDPQRAAALARSVCEQVGARLQQLRNQRAAGLIDELVKTTTFAQADLDEATARLASLEKQVGEDLGELRILNESASGESNLRQTLIQIRNELRQAGSEQQANGQLLQLLQAAQNDPSHLRATPNRLLEAQPQLRQLKDGLVAAQLRSAELLGQMHTVHPRVQAALASEQQIRQNLRSELSAAVQGLEAELSLSAARVGQLERQLAEISGRMNRVAQLRAGYNNLVNEVQHRSEILSRARQNLADAQADQAAAHSASLITMLDSPTVGNHPAGPRKSTIVLAGLFGGLMTGLGIVFLTLPAPACAEDTARATGSISVPQPEKSRRSAGHRGRLVDLGLSLKQALARIAQVKLAWN